MASQLMHLPEERVQSGAWSGPWRPVLRKLPFALLAIGFAAFLLTDLRHAVSYEALIRHHAEIAAYVKDAPGGAMLAFVAAYALVAAFALPLSGLMTMLGGYLFGVWVGAGLVLAGAIMGATALFIAAKGALHDFFERHTRGALAKLKDGFHADAFAYLVVLRLIPVLPFGVVNVAAALLGLRLATFIPATLLGIIPATFLYVWLGVGFGSVLDKGREPDLGIIFEPQVLGALIGIALLALAPVLYRRLARRRRVVKT